MRVLSTLTKQWFPDHCAKSELRQRYYGRVGGGPGPLMPQPEQPYLVKILAKNVPYRIVEMLKSFGVGVVLFALGRRQHRCCLLAHIRGASSRQSWVWIPALPLPGGEDTEPLSASGLSSTRSVTVVVTVQIAEN